MSLKTTPYKPARYDEETPMDALNLTAPVDFFYPDGTTRTLRMFEAIYLCGMYARRGAPCAIYAVGTRDLVLEFNDQQLRATPALFEAVKALLSVLKAECDDAVEKARIADASKAGAYGPGDAQGMADAAAGQAPQPPASSNAPTSVTAAADAAAAATDEDSRGANRFRRGRR